MLQRPLAAAALLLSFAFSSIARAPAQTILVADAAGLLREAPNLRPGNVLLLAPGTYQVPSLVLRGLAGRPDAWITIRGHAGQTHIVGTALKNVVDVTDCAFVRLEDLDITCTGAYGSIDGLKFAYATNSHHFMVDNCRLHDLTGNGVSSQADSLDRLTLHRCEIARIAASGVYLGYDSPLRLATNTTIQSCWFHDVAAAASPHYAIQIKGGSYGARIQDNVIHDVTALNAAAIAVYYADAAGRQPPEKWNVIRGNALWRCGSEGIYATNSAVIEDNVLVDVDSGIVTTSYGGKAVDNLRLVHNTVFRSRTVGMYLGEFNRADGTCLVANNALLMARPDVEAVHAGQGIGGATFRGNVCYGIAYGPGLAGGVIAAATPSLELLRADAVMAAELLDLTPRAGSKLEDSVDGSLGAARDFVGQRRPRQQGADAGALEQRPGGMLWPLTAGWKPAVGALAPLLQEIVARSGGVATFAIDVDAPTGTWVVLLPSLAGPSTTGLVPVIPDGLTLLPFGGAGGAMFGGYLAQLGPDGRASMRLTLPPLPLPYPESIYHGAVLVPPTGARWATNVVRVVLRRSPGAAPLACAAPMQPQTTTTSVIVASYNQPNSLALVLEGVLAQDAPIDDVVIADDGSEADTAELVESFRARSAIPLVFTTQEDRGFRKAKALNNAIRRSRGDLLLFLDGDCIPPPGWAARFVAALRAGADFATAGYVLMDLERTRARTRQEAASGTIAAVVTAAEREAFRRVHRKERLYALLGKRKKPRILGGNWAVTRRALVAVNGFDEQFEGVGKEDSDVRNRLRNAGCRGVSLWDCNWVFHCSHDLDPRRTRPEVLRRPGVADYYVTRRRAVACEHGLVERAVDG